jgi:hypothetical protein
MSATIDLTDPIFHDEAAAPARFNVICWVVERSFASLSRYRWLNTIFERSNRHLIVFVPV